MGVEAFGKRFSSPSMPLAMVMMVIVFMFHPNQVCRPSLLFPLLISYATRLPFTLHCRVQSIRRGLHFRQIAIHTAALYSSQDAALTWTIKI